MLLTIAPAALVPLVVVIALTGIRTHRMLSDEASRYVQQVAVSQAGEIGAKLGDKTISLRAFAQALTEYHRIPAAVRREVISEMLKAVFRSQSEVKAVWTLWEPGAIEDDPIPYQGTPLSRQDGRFTATWYRTERGTLQGRLTDEAHLKEFYLEPKQKMTPVLIKPYKQSYTETHQDETTVFSICVPVVFGGAFCGAVGIDIEVSVYQRVVEPISIYGSGYAVMTTSDGLRISHPIVDLVGTSAGDDLDTVRRAEMLRLIAGGNPFTLSKKARATGKDSLVFGVPIRAGTAMPHWMLLLVVPTKEITRQADYALNTLIAFGVAAAVIIVGAILWVARRLSMPIIALTNDIERMADGTKPGKVTIQGVNELASLASSFNIMTERLGSTLDNYDKANRQLGVLNEELELKVSKRTADLEQTLNELRAAQDHMIKAEKFALLGRLSAAVAHDLNTPLGAVRSSADFLITMKEEALLSLITFSSGASPLERETFIRILRHGVENAQRLSSESNRADRRSFAKKLEIEGYEDAEEIANDVEALGLLHETEDVMTLLKGGNREAIAAVAKTAAQIKAGYIIKMSSEKAAATVSSLGNYVRTEEFDIDETIDPAKEIDDLLVLYYGKMKGSVSVVRDYRCTEKVRGLRDKLNQVWVNLINNALQAMETGGTMEIRTIRDGDWLAVSIIDSGPGIPEDIKEKIFTPFFTTKVAGEGTGLGLDICRKIVERHGGSIGFESRPGRTAFTVRLPLQKQELSNL